MLSYLDEQNDDDMEEYIMNKIKNLQEGQNFTNYNFINSFFKLVISSLHNGYFFTLLIAANPIIATIFMAK